MRKIFSTIFYPYNSNQTPKFNIVLIGIGGNVGNVVRRFKKLFLFFKSHPDVKILKTAPIYKNPPFGYLEQNDFYNSLILVDTKMAPGELLKFLLYVEKKFGRKRSFKNAPRSLDLDIIFFNNQKISKKNLNIPHPYFIERDSVLVPLSLLGKR